jgi:hypothetical protein
MLGHLTDQAQVLDGRERACNEAVLEFGAEPHAYAESILKPCEHYLESSLAWVASQQAAHGLDEGSSCYFEVR